MGMVAGFSLVVMRGVVGGVGGVLDLNVMGHLAGDFQIARRVEILC